MELNLTNEQQKKLFEAYQVLKDISEEITIQLQPNQCILLTKDDQTTIVTWPKDERKEKLEIFIQDIFNAQVIFDMELSLIDDFDELIKAAHDPLKSKGQQVFAYSQVWNSLEKLHGKKRGQLVVLYREVEKKVRKGGRRIVDTSRKCHQLMEALGSVFVYDFRYISISTIATLSQTDLDYIIKQYQQRTAQNEEAISQELNSKEEMIVEQNFE